MSYTSFAYLVLIAITCLVYYCVPKKTRWVVLLVSGIVFYLSAGPEELLLFLAAMTASYIAAQKIGDCNTQIKALKDDAQLSKEEKKERKNRLGAKKKRYLWLGIGLPLAILLVVKYTNFLIGTLYSLVPALWHGEERSLIRMVVPLGISFYTFQMIAYMMDVYKGKTEPQRNYFRHVLYLSFFPSVVQGPIPRYCQLAPQLYEGHDFSFDNLKNGATLILWGLAKKLILAERLSLFVSTIFDHPSEYEGIIFAVATVAFSIQIYADFSGCMDIASGTARLFGITLAPNFLRPYFSRTMPEFWRRWHASLGSWFRDYVFFPFSISSVSLRVNQWARKHFGEGAGRIVSASLPILVVWILTGIWHGPEWKYVLWGLFHGILIICSTIFSPLLDQIAQQTGMKRDCYSFRLFQMGRTFLLCCVGRVFFRAESVSAAFVILRRMCQTTGLYLLSPKRLFTYGINQKNMCIVAIFLVIWLMISILEETLAAKKEQKDVLTLFSEQNLIFRWTVLYLLLFSVVIFGQYGPGFDVADFIYEKF